MVNRLKASAGITASVVSTLARAIMASVSLKLVRGPAPERRRLALVGKLEESAEAELGRCCPSSSSRSDSGEAENVSSDADSPDAAYLPGSSVSPVTVEVEENEASFLNLVPVTILRGFLPFTVGEGLCRLGAIPFKLKA